MIETVGYIFYSTNWLLFYFHITALAHKRHLRHYFWLLLGILEPFFHLPWIQTDWFPFKSIQFAVALFSYPKHNTDIHACYSRSICVCLLFFSNSKLCRSARCEPTELPGYVTVPVSWPAFSLPATRFDQHQLSTCSSCWNLFHPSVLIIQMFLDSSPGAIPNYYPPGTTWLYFCSSLDACHCRKHIIKTFCTGFCIKFPFTLMKYKEKVLYFFLFFPHHLLHLLRWISMDKQMVWMVLNTFCTQFYNTINTLKHCQFNIKSYVLRLLSVMKGNLQCITCKTIVAIHCWVLKSIYLYSSFCKKVIEQNAVGIVRVSTILWSIFSS